MLVNHADAALDGVTWGGQPRRLAIKVDRSRVRLEIAVYALGKRGFSGTVFAKQAMYLTSSHVQRDTVIRQDLGKTFGESLYPENCFH